MVVAASKLKFVESFEDPFSAYGNWNALLAEDSDRRHLGWIPVCEHDFFPESPFEYIETIRKTLTTHINNPLDYVQPVQVDIDITQICNSNCTFCFSRQYQNKHYKNAIIGLKRLESVLEELAQLGTKCVRFSGGGDALTHPNIKDLLPLPHVYGMRLGLISNLDLLSDDLLNDIFHHVDHLRWSVNAISDDCRLGIHRPRGTANLLSKNICYIKKLIKHRRCKRYEVRCPMVWATFLLLPENVDEIVEFANCMQAIGVDGIFFRPVFHGLVSDWSCDDKIRMFGALRIVKSMEQPGFNVFVSKQNIMRESGTASISRFSRCLSRRLRTILEASHNGPILQSCGACRGMGADINNNLDVHGSFQKTWENFLNVPFSGNKNLECETCLDISFNRALNFIHHILQIDNNARFRRVELSGHY